MNRTVTNREWARAKFRKWDPEFRYIWEVYHEEILRHLGPGKVWVDVGCGGNPHVAEFGSHAGLAAGTDLFFPEGSVHRPFLVSVLPRLPFRDASVDVVTLHFVVEHLEDPGAACREIARVLKPGGKLVVVTTNAYSPWILLTRFIPFRLKNFLIRTLYKVREDDVLPTFHRLNTAARFRSTDASGELALLRLDHLQDVNFTRKWLFWFFFAGHLLTRRRGTFLRTNLLGVFGKRDSRARDPLLAGDLPGD